MSKGSMELTEQHDNDLPRRAECRRAILHSQEPKIYPTVNGTPPRPGPGQGGGTPEARE